VPRTSLWLLQTHGTRVVDGIYRTPGHHHSCCLAFWVYLGLHDGTDINVKCLEPAHDSCLKLTSTANCVPARCKRHPNWSESWAWNQDCREGGPSPPSVHSITSHKSSWQNCAWHYRSPYNRSPRAQRGSRGIALLISTSALGGGGWSAPRPSRFTPWKDPVPIVQEAGWAPGPVWTCAKNLAPIGIWSPDHPARSQSLYQLSYLAHCAWHYCA
jgi:hypothetical protein